MYGREYTDIQTEFSRYAKLLGHPIRVAILEMLTKNSELTFGEIASTLPVTNATVTQHLQMFKDAELVKTRFDQPFVRYSLNKEKKEELLNVMSQFLKSIQ